MSDQDTVAPVPAEALVARVLGDPDYAARAREHLERAVEVLDLLRVAAIRATHPSDWIIHGGTAAYLTDAGCARAKDIWGCSRVILGLEREPLEDGTFIARARIRARCLRTGAEVEEIGSRWSGSKFFARLARRTGVLDPTMVDKAALANADGRALRYLAGLGACPVSLLERAWGGSDPLKLCARVDYRGGRDAADEEAAEVVAEARAAGEPGAVMVPPEVRKLEVRTWTAALVGATDLEALRQTWAALTAAPTWAEASDDLKRYWVTLKDSVKAALAKP